MNEPQANRAELLPMTLALMCVAMFNGGVVVIATGPLLPSIMNEFGITLSRAGFVPMAFFLGRTAGGLALVFLLAGVPLKRILALSYVIQAAALAAAGLLSSGIWPFFALYLVVGIATAMPLTLPGMWVSAHIRAGTARTMAVVVAPYALATVITPWLVGALLGAGSSWRWILVGEAGLSMVCAAIAARSPFPDISGRSNLRLREFKEVVALNPGLLAVIIVAGFMYVGLESSFGVWLPKFQQSVFSAGVTSAALSVTIFWAGQLIGRLSTAPLARRLATPRLVLWFGSFSIILCLVSALSPNRGVSTAAVFAVGLATSPLWALLSSYCSRFPHWHAGLLYTVMGLAGGLGSIAFPYMIGPVAEAQGFRLAMALIAVPAALVAALYFYLRRVDA